MGCSDSIRLKAPPRRHRRASLRVGPQPRDDKGRFAQAANDQARQFGLALEMEEAS